MNYDELDKLNDLRQKGAISEEEYQAQKARILNSGHEATDLSLGLSDNNYNAIMNFIQLLPGFGWIISIIMWIIGHEKSPKIDQQGKHIINWIISAFIYSAITGLITLITFGFGSFMLWPVGIALACCSFLFPIIGGIKSLSGMVWRYPLSIQFLK